MKLQGDVSQRRRHLPWPSRITQLSTDLEKRKQEKLYRRRCAACLLASFCEHAELFREDAFKLRVVFPAEHRRKLVAGLVLSVRTSYSNTSFQAAAVATQSALGSDPRQTTLEEFCETGGEHLPAVIQAE